MKLVDLMEHGAVKGGERLVPHLFQFLVLLANDQSKLVTVPQVCVKYISCVCRYTDESITMVLLIRPTVAVHTHTSKYTHTSSVVC